MTQKPTIKIDGVEISQTTPYIDYDAWMASPLTKALKDKLEAAVAAEREACAKVIDDLSLAHPGRADLTALQCAAAIRARGGRVGRCYGQLIDHIEFEDDDNAD
jgi:hypothetical protein